ncbi:MAG: beta-ketoacyl-ACP synthase II, partial [Azorhizobium sp. 39-67-5]
MAHTDKHGRPIVVVTGIGIVSSLGQGKEDNWRRLTAGESGIHRITRFPIEGMRTTIAGTVDFLFDERVPAPDLSERLATLAAEEAIAQSGVGSKGNFPGPLFAAVPPVEMEWPEKRKLAENASHHPVEYRDLLLSAASGKFRPWHERF